MHTAARAAPSVTVLSGFPGSGKTSLLLGLAKAEMRLARRTVIIENEAGEVGVDGPLLSAEGLEVREIYGGCICCTLRLDLAETLKQLHRAVCPERIFIEASGIADPQDVMTVVRGALPLESRVRLVVVIDASRYEMLAEMMAPMLESQAGAADWIALNKIDLVSVRDAESIMDELRRASSDATVVAVCATSASSLDLLIGALS
jgi:G3E family GTPase